MTSWLINIYFNFTVCLAGHIDRLLSGTRFVSIADDKIYMVNDIDIDTGDNNYWSVKNLLRSRYCIVGTLACRDLLGCRIIFL